MAKGAPKDSDGDFAMGADTKVRAKLLFAPTLFHEMG